MKNTRAASRLTLSLSVNGSKRISGRGTIGTSSSAMYVVSRIDARLRRITTATPRTEALYHLRSLSYHGWHTLDDRVGIALPQRSRLHTARVAAAAALAAQKLAHDLLSEEEVEEEGET